MEYSFTYFIKICFLFLSEHGSEYQIWRNIPWKKLCPTSELISIHFRTANKNVNSIARISNVRTFWETHKIWKNLPHGFDKSADLLSKCQNHEEDVFELCVLLRKSELYEILHSSKLDLIKKKVTILKFNIFYHIDDRKIRKFIERLLIKESYKI